MNSQEIAVHIEHVYKNYTSGHSIVHALKDISLDIYKGELIMVVGPSGSGKTTLLSLVGGTLSFNSGEISVFDNPLHTMTEEELTLFRKDHIGFIFQQFHLIPTLTTAENVAIPLLIHQVPWEKALKKAEETITRLETQLGGQMTGKTTKKVNLEDTKKRMMELTRELFKERSMDRRAEIKKEIVMLKGLLHGKGGKAAAGGLPKGSLYTALKTEQEMEVKEAKNRIHSIYSENLKSLLAAMEAQRAVEHREPAFETFSKNIMHLENTLMEIIDKYQNYLTAKHSAELAKLKAKGQSTPESETLKGTLKDFYSHDFSSLKNSIGEEVHSQLETKRAVLFEDAGDPNSVKLSQVAGTSEESLFNLLQAKDSRTYEKYARGEIERSEALMIARKLMAKETGLDEDTINKRFGGK